MDKKLSRSILFLLLVLFFCSSAFAMQYWQLPEGGQAEEKGDICKPGNILRETEIIESKLMRREKNLRSQLMSAAKKENSPATTAMTKPKQGSGDKQETSQKATKPQQEQFTTIIQTKRQDKEKNAVITDSSTKIKAATAEESKPKKKDIPSNLYSLGAAREFTFLSQAVVKNKGDEIASNISIHIPLVTASSPYFSLRSETFSLQPKEIQTANGTRIGIFTIAELQPGEEVTLEIYSKVRCSKITFFADYQPEGGKQITSYLGSAKGIESTNGQIISLAQQLTAGLASDWEKAHAITKWVASNIRYDANRRSGGALSALTSRSGVCEDFAKLSAALARAAKIPARVVYGYADSGSKWPQSGSFSLRTYRHAWVEFYLTGRGWVPADPTLSNSAKLYFGTLPHNRYIIQNYSNQALKGKFSGGQLAISWSDMLL